MGELFDYVMQTPGNTNPAVLSSEIQKLIDENIVQSDWNESAKEAKSYIKNKPFSENVIGNYGEKIELMDLEKGECILAFKLPLNESYNIKTFGYEALTSFPYSPNSTIHQYNEIITTSGKLVLSDWSLQKFSSTSTKKIDAENYSFSMGFGTIYVIVSLATLSEANKTKFPDLGVYVERGSQSFPSNYASNKIYFCNKIISERIPTRFLPTNTQGKIISDPYNHFTEKTVEGALGQIGSQLSSKELILDSSTADSTKKFKITVDDTGTITATEINET